MKKLLIVYMYMFSFSCIFSQNSSVVLDTSKISSIKIITYEIKDNVLEKIIGKRVGSGRYLKYNLEGDLTYENQFNKSDSIILEIYYEYDSNGNKIKVLHKHIDENLNFKNEYFYDDNNRLIKNMYYQGDSLVSISVPVYNNKGNKIKTLSYNKDGKLTGKSISKYNSKNELIEHTSLNNDSTILFQFFYEYDDKGNMLFYKQNYLMFSLNSETFKKYNNKGEHIETRVYNYKDELITNQSFSYTYDKYGNLISKVIYENNKPKHIIEMEIKYF